GHTIVAYALALDHDLQEPPGAVAEEEAFEDDAGDEGGGPTDQIGNACTHTGCHDQRERFALHRVEACPGGGGGKKETHGDGGNESPQHFVRVPRHGEEGRRDHAGREDPDGDRNQRPGAAADVERTKAQAQEDGWRGGFIHGRALRACGWVRGSFDSRTTGCGQCAWPIRLPVAPFRGWAARRWFRERVRASGEIAMRRARAGPRAWASACRCMCPCPAKSMTRTSP